jgi:hypothetical protein
MLVKSGAMTSARNVKLGLLPSQMINISVKNAFKMQFVTEET